MKFSAAVLLFINLFTLQAAPAADPETLIFTNVNIVDTRSGNLERNMTVVIKNGQIDGIAKVGLIQESRKIRVVNANGKFLIPGLWDMHVHSAGGSAPAWDERSSIRFTSPTVSPACVTWAAIQLCLRNVGSTSSGARCLVRTWFLEDPFSRVARAMPKL